MLLREAVSWYSQGSSHCASKHQDLEETRSQCDQEKVKPALPRPLLPPTTFIVGDSIIRHVHFFNAVTRCFPGATVPVILNELPELLHSLPGMVTKIIVHVGYNDIARKQSELLKSF